MNFITILLTALIPLFLGAIWYNPKVFGTIWMREAEMTDEKMKKTNLFLIFGLTYIFGILASLALVFAVVHQFHVMSILVDEPGFNEVGSEMHTYYKEFMEKFGKNYRTFKHGALHGTITGFTLGLPILAINALFERKSFKYIAINAGYWIICFAIMGGCISQFI